MLPTLTLVANIQKMETRQTQTGKNVTTLNLSAGDKNAKGDWENLYISGSFWEKQSDFVSQYFKEGDAIIITGKLVTTNYTKQDGTKVFETKFHFPQASFVPKSKEPQQPQQEYQAPQPTQNQQPAMPVLDIEESNIPFAPLKAW